MMEFRLSASMISCLICLQQINIDFHNTNFRLMGDYENLQSAKRLYGKLFADKGYISQKLFDFLFEDGIQLVTGLRVNMKNKLMPFYDRMMLRKRYIIETILYIQPVSDGMGREFTYLSSHATNRYFIPNWGVF